MSTLADKLFEKDIPSIQSNIKPISNIKNESKLINISMIKDNPLNRELNMDKVHEYVQSIKQVGLIHDPVVKANSDSTYTLLAGHHRIAACRILAETDKNYETIRCKVKDIDDIDAELILLDSNVRNNPLSPYEKMMAIGRIEELYRVKQVSGTLRDVIAEDSSLKPTQVGTYLRIYKKGSDEVKQALKNESISLTKASQLAKLSIEEQRLALRPKRKKEKVSEDEKKLTELYALIEKSFISLDNLVDYLYDHPDLINSVNDIVVKQSSVFKTYLRSILPLISDKLSSIK